MVAHPDQLIKALGLLARLQHQRRRFDTAGGKARKQGVQMSRGDIPVGDDSATDARIVPGDFRARLGDQARTDDDIVAALAEFDTKQFPGTP